MDRRKFVTYMDSGAAALDVASTVESQICER